MGEANQFNKSVSKANQLNKSIGEGVSETDQSITLIKILVTPFWLYKLVEYQ